MLRENDSPDKAVQFSNLYTRLLTQPVLSQKWAILYLLHQLADSSSEDGGSGSRVGQPHNPGRRVDSQDRGLRNESRNDEESTFKDAFATAGLPKLPSHRPKITSDTSGADRRTRHRDTKRSDAAGDNSQEPENDPTECPSEAALLRDLPFTLQGLSTTNLPFTSLTTLDLPPKLPFPILSLLYTLAEPSLLYRSLSAFVQSRDEGLIGQSLRSAIGSELRSYLGLISTLEGEIRRAITSLSKDESEGRVGKAGVTLKRCVVWTREATMGLRLMSLMVEEAKSTCRMRYTLASTDNMKPGRVAS